MSDTVLIVGAGPVGLAGAVSLAKLGIPFRIIDKLATPTNQSRAAIIHARTLEYFERLGIVDDFLAAGVRVYGISVYGPENKLINRASLEHLPTPYPFMLGLEQFETERLLTARLEAQGLHVEREIELAGLSDHGDFVTAQLRHADGTETEENFAYVLGTDGARSSVRKALNLHLEGNTLDATWITADVRIRWDRDPAEAVAFLTTKGIVFIAPMNDDRWRVILNSPLLSPEEEEKIGLAEVQAIINERCGTSIPLYDPVWISPFAINTRIASTMNVGRVFLSGDASHVHSPLGGQGMNTGIQDVLNLTWKIALVLKGQAPSAFLESYNVERHGNARRLLNEVGPATRMANLRHPVAIEIRNHLVHFAYQMGLTKRLANTASMLDISYPESPIISRSGFNLFAHGPKPGERAPEAEDLITHESAETLRLFQIWSGDLRHQLLVFQNEAEEIPATLAPEQLCAVLRIARQGLPAAGLVIDTQGHAHSAYAAGHGEWYLVRPDGVIAIKGNAGEFGELKRYWATHFVA